MFKVYKRTIRIGKPENPQQRFEYQVEENSRSSVSNILTTSAMIAGAISGMLVLSAVFAVLLIPLGIIGFKAWRRLKTAQKQAMHGAEDESIVAEYTVLSNNDKP